MQRTQTRSPAFPHNATLLSRPVLIDHTCHAHVDDVTVANATVSFRRPEQIKTPPPPPRQRRPEPFHTLHSAKHGLSRTERYASRVNYG